MADPQDTQKTKDMTAADAAKLVCREVPLTDKQGKPTGDIKEVAVKAGEVLSFKDYGSHVVVVTTDGQKLRGDKAAK